MNTYLSGVIKPALNRLLTCVVIIYSLASVHAYANPLSFDDALQLAERHAPVLEAQQAQVNAVNSLTISAGALPDPKLSIGIENFPISGPPQFSFAEEPMAMAKIGVMLSGDSITTARAVAGKHNIDQVFAEVLPEQKVEVAKRLQSEGRKVAMAGDGINDALALSRAVVGIFIGTGTDVAMESAGVTLIKRDLWDIARARHLSQPTMRNIRQNLFFAFIYNSLGVPFATGVLYPLFGILLSPMIAATAMTLSSLSAVMNVLRLQKTGL